LAISKTPSHSQSEYAYFEYKPEHILLAPVIILPSKNENISRTEFFISWNPVSKATRYKVILTAYVGTQFKPGSGGLIEVDRIILREYYRLINLGRPPETIDLGEILKDILKSSSTEPVKVKPHSLVEIERKDKFAAILEVETSTTKIAVNKVDIFEKILAKSEPSYRDFLKGFSVWDSDLPFHNSPLFIYESLRINLKVEAIDDDKIYCPNSSDSVFNIPIRKKKQIGPGRLPGPLRLDIHG
ncbi:MAG: hypothetical protein ACRDCN_00275, partial [Tannerellaceae bacterium]